MDYRDNRQRWAESHQVVHFYAGQWCTFTPALTRSPGDNRGPTDPSSPGQAGKALHDRRRKALSMETIVLDGFDGWSSEDVPSLVIDSIFDDAEFKELLWLDI